MTTAAVVATIVFAIVLLGAIGFFIYYAVTYNPSWLGKGVINGGNNGGPTGPTGSFAFQSQLDSSYMASDILGNVVLGDPSESIPQVLTFTSSNQTGGTVFTVASGPSSVIGYVLGGIGSRNQVVVRPISEIQSQNGDYIWNFQNGEFRSVDGSKKGLDYGIANRNSQVRYTSRVGLTQALLWSTVPVSG